MDLNTHVLQMILYEKGFFVATTLEDPVQTIHAVDVVMYLRP